MRKSTRAALIAEYLENPQASPLARQDPEIAGMLGLARTLESVSRVEIRPHPERQAEIKLRLLQEREALVHIEPPKSGPKFTDLVRPVPAGRRRYAYVGAAALVMVALLVVTSFWFFGGPGREVTPGSGNLLALNLSTGGTVEVRNPQGAWETVSGNRELQPGEAVRTSADRAEVRVGEAALFRLDGGSEIEITGVGPDSVALNLGAGKAYHRINLPTRYAVNIGSVNCSAQGTAFDTERSAAGGLLVLATQHDTEIAHEVLNSSGRMEAGRQVLTQGNQFSLEDVDREGQPGIMTSITPEGPDLDWLRYNLAMDIAQGWDPGILPEITREQLPPPPPADPGTVSLQGSEGTSGVNLQWQVTGADPGSFEILRSVSTRQPAWPADIYKTLNDPAAHSFTDTAYEKGVTYYYRVAKLIDGERVYSNAVTVQTQAVEPPPPPPVEPKITLTGYQVPDSSTAVSVQLKWFIEGDAQVDGWMVCRTFDKYDPSYPPTGDRDLDVAVPYQGTRQGYLDTQGLYTGYTCRYRIAAMYRGKVVVYSNTFSVTIQTVVP